MKLEGLRRQVRLIHTAPIKDLEGLPIGIAQFETLIEEYEAVGGRGHESDAIRASPICSPYYCPASFNPTYCMEFY